MGQLVRVITLLSAGLALAVAAACSNPAAAGRPSPANSATGVLTSPSSATSAEPLDGSLEQLEQAINGIESSISGADGSGGE